MVFKIEYGKICFEYLGRDAKTNFKNDFLREKTQPSCILKKGEIKWGNWRIKYSGKYNGAGSKTGPLYVRSWKPGDRFQPFGMKGSKKLQDFFIDQKIPKSERHNVPIIVDKKDRILSVSNFRVAKGAGNLKQYLQINKI